MCGARSARHQHGSSAFIHGRRQVAAFKHFNPSTGVHMDSIHPVMRDALNGFAPFIQR